MINKANHSKISKIINYLMFFPTFLFILYLLLITIQHCRLASFIVRLAFFSVFILYLINGVILIKFNSGYYWTRTSIKKADKTEAFRRGIFEILLALLSLTLMILFIS